MIMDENHDRVAIAAVVLGLLSAVLAALTAQLRDRKIGYALRQPIAVRVVQLDVECLEPSPHRRSDATGPDGADGHTLEVVRSPYAIGDVPAPA